MPVTDEAAGYAKANRYADTTAPRATARMNFETGRWKLPIGSFVVVDDADHLHPPHLRYLIDHAERTNTKLLLLTSDGREPAHNLITALDTDLQWAQQLGTPALSQQRVTAIERAEHHRADQYHDEVARLLHRRNELVRQYQDLDQPHTHTRGTEQQRRRTRGRDHGVEL